MRFKLILLFIILSVGLFGQSKTDSLIALLPNLSDTARIRTLNSIALQLSFKDITKSRQYAEQALETSRMITSEKGEAESLCILCSIMSQQGQFTQALESCRKAEIIYERLASKVGLADMYNRTGMVYNQQGEYPLALENFSKSLMIRRELNQKTEVPLAGTVARQSIAPGNDPGR